MDMKTKFVWSVVYQAEFQFIKMNFHADMMNRYLLSTPVLGLFCG